MGITVNRIGLGTAAIGRPSYINIRQENNSFQSLNDFCAKGMAVLERAYSLGVRYFDTAPGYGLAESLLMDWVKKKGDPDIQVATKWGYTYVANFKADAELHEIKEHSLAKLNEQWSNSMALLPNLKVYQIHSATLETGVLINQEILHRLREIKNEYDLVIGLTTSGANQSETIKKALDVEFEGKQLFELFQVSYNIFEQSFANLARELAKDKKQLIVKEAMANGRVFPNQNYPAYSEAYQVLSSLAEKLQVGIDAIALRFCIQSIPSTRVLSGAANERHLSDNLQANAFELTVDDLEMLQQLAVDPYLYWEERKQLIWQ